MSSSTTEVPGRVVAAPLGWWSPAPGMSLGALSVEPGAICEAIRDVSSIVCLVRTDDGIAVARGGQIVIGEVSSDEALPVVGIAHPCRLDQLGDPAFRNDHGLRYAYVTGAMANGIASCDIVEAISRAGMLGFFGAAGLAPDAVEKAIIRLRDNLGDAPWGTNFIHSPSDPKLEAAICDLYLKHKVRLVEASAFLDLTLPIVRYRVHGIHRDPVSGVIVTPNRVMAKISRIEVATRFFSPPPEKFLAALVANGDITAEQAKLASQIPMAQDLTAEADSGGHTDNRPAISLIPTMIALRDRMQAKYGYTQALRVGAAGGVATPASAVAALAMGASYLVTGSVNQACVESGSCDIVRQMLAEAEQADIIMAPAADMFEMGVKVQVLKRGTMFAMRGAKLYEIYRAYNSIDAIPTAERASLEKTFFRAPLEEIWRQTEQYFLRRDPSQVEKANRDGKHKMALVFRWYLGQSSRWANAGEASRKIDYQVWCGPAMGAFNEWVKGSPLEQPANRRVATVAMNMLYGAAVLTRVNALRSQGAPLPTNAGDVTPMLLSDLQERLH